jgi:hypothetical protein
MSGLNSPRHRSSIGLDGHALRPSHGSAASKSWQPDIGGAAAGAWAEREHARCALGAVLETFEVALDLDWH